MAVLGEPRNVFAGHNAWQSVEDEMGVALPYDYKHLVDAYGPVQLNGHLYLEHPANTFYPLGKWISDTIDTLRDIEQDREISGAHHLGPVFGRKYDLIPLTRTDRGEYAFLDLAIDGGQTRILTCDRDETDLHEHRMMFSEWLYRYLEGQEMFSPGHSDYYPGPLLLESLPTGMNDIHSEWYGPDRGN
ncbi:SMI1/KNR4 family protein [Streptomyces sp. NPDC004267]|uniref:SMI1/KNR4 family protein n=1 Tax=Streptomyces sp. NPDC004267 TaxID=3364694 RepID=UPI0036C28EC2